MAKINSQEGKKRFKELQENLSRKRQAEITRELKLFGLTDEADLISRKIGELSKNENIVLKSTKLQLNRSGKINHNEIIDDAIKKLDHIRGKKHFYVSLAYMKKQKKVNQNILILNKRVLSLTSIVLIFMAIQIILWVLDAQT